MKTEQLLDVYSNVFVNRLDVYTKQYLFYERESDNIKCIYIPVRKAVTKEVLLAHLNGKITIGWPPFDCNGYAKWLCFDSDTDDGQLDKLQTFLEKHRWYCVREGKRLGRAGHLWLFFDKPVPASELRILAQAMMSLAGVVIEEVFPKQNKSPIGNVVRGPLGIHRKPDANNCRGWFEGPPQEIKAQLIWLSQRALNSSSTAMQLAHKHRPLPKPRFIRRSNYSNNIDFVEYALDEGFERNGDELIGACPACQDIGHDTDDNHLSINVTNGLAHCWRDCEFGNIVKAIRCTNWGKLNIYTGASTDRSHLAVTGADPVVNSQADMYEGYPNLAGM